MEKMLVTQGLNELKTLDSRIDRVISESRFISAARTSDEKVTPAILKEDFKKEAISSYDSVNALIERREKIKSAIVECNAKTMVEICGNTYSVAKVIDMKSSIQYKELLLLKMKEQYKDALAVMNRQNSVMEEKIDQLVSTAYGKESKTNIKEDDYIAIAKPYREANEYSLVNPLDLEKKINELETFIEDFTSNVDAILQISNCITSIEF